MTDVPQSVTIVGASLAGHASARALRRHGFDGRITLVGEELVRPYDRPPLSKEFLAGTMTVAELSLEVEAEDLGAEWRLGRRAVALDPGTHSVTLDDGSVVHAEAVVVATGSRARRLAGAPPGVHTVRTLTDAEALRAELRPGARLVVVGAGFIGAEIASTAHYLGVDVTIVEAAPAPLAGPLGVAMGAAVATLHDGNGVRLHLGVPVGGFLGTERVTAVRLTDGTELAADVVVAGVGADPAVDWLDGSGLDISAGLVCSAAGATAAPGVFGVGDCSAWFDDVRGHPFRVEHWTDSRDRPVLATAALLGDSSAHSVRAPYFWSDQYGVRIQFAGRRRGDEEVVVEAGSPETADVLATYRRDGEVVAVLGMNQPKLFMKFRKSLPSSRVVPAEAGHAHFAAVR